MTQETCAEGDHRMKIGTTMYVGKRWRCLDCGQLMECTGVSEYEEVSDNE